MDRNMAMVWCGEARSPVRRAVKLTIIIASVMALFLVAAPTSQAATRGNATSQACASVGSHAASQSVCRVMPASGTFTLPIPGTAAVIIGTGTPDRAGKAIVISRAPLVCPSLGGFGIRLSTPTSEKLLPPLHWTNGTLFFRDHPTGRCVGVASPALAAAPGVYQVVPSSGVSPMPGTGGGANRTTASGSQLSLFGMLCLFAGVVMRFGRRIRRA